MADETFEIGFQVTGGELASKSFEDVRVAELKAKEEASKLAAELRKLQKSGEGSAAKIEELQRQLIRAQTASQQLGQHARRLQREHQGATTSATAQNQALAALGDTTARVSNSLGQATSRAGVLTQAFSFMATVAGGADSQLAKMSSAIGNVGSAAAAGAMAFGPWGAAVGAALVAGRELVGHFQEQAEASRRASEAITTQVTALERLEQAVARQRATDRLARGLGTVEEQTRALTSAQDRQQGVSAELERAQEHLRRKTEEYRRAVDRARIVEREQGELTEEQQGRLRRLTREYTQASQAVQQYSQQMEIAAGEIEVLNRALITSEHRTGQNERAQQEARAAERARESARAAAHRNRQAMLAEQARLDRMVEDQEAAFHQTAMSRIAEITQQIETTGDIIDNEVADAREATTAFLADLERRAQAERDRRDIAARAVRQHAQLEAQTRESDLQQYRDYIAQLQTADQEAADRYRARLTEREEDHRAHVEVLREMEESQTQWTAQQYAQRVTFHREMLRMQREETQRSQARIRKMEDEMWGDLAGTVKSAAGDMAKFLIEGAQGGEEAFAALLKSFLEATSIEYTIKALAEVANAVAAAARQDYSAAAQHGVAAGLAAGVAAATGLGAAAIPSAPSAGAGDGGAARADQGARGGDGGTTNVTVQMYAPHAILTEAERGQMIANGLREARRNFGNGAVRY